MIIRFSKYDIECIYILKAKKVTKSHKLAHLEVPEVTPNSMNIKWFSSTPDVLEITRLLIYDSPEVERAYENMMIIKSNNGCRHQNHRKELERRKPCKDGFFKHDDIGLVVPTPKSATPIDSKWVFIQRKPS